LPALGLSGIFMPPPEAWLPGARADTGAGDLKTTITVELDGTRFLLEEAAFAALRAYLDRAGARLGNHPDRADVLAGLERTIAARLGRARPATDQPIDADEMRGALAAVGRVEGPVLGDEPRSDGGRRGPRKLYRLREGQKIAGVCAGLAAYAEIDVSLVRLAFIFGALFSGGVLVAGYIALMFVMPVARTEDEEEAARGGRTAG
jgi:phage shock protein PspC (stress-responsive transcriptional regulator)